MQHRTLWHHRPDPARGRARARLLAMLTVTAAPAGRSWPTRPHSLRKAGSAAVRIQTARCSLLRSGPATSAPPRSAGTSFRLAASCGPNLVSRSTGHAMPVSATGMAAAPSDSCFARAQRFSRRQAAARRAKTWAASDLVNWHGAAQACYQLHAEASEDDCMSPGVNVSSTSKTAQGTLKRVDRPAARLEGVVEERPGDQAAGFDDGRLVAALEQLRLAGVQRIGRLLRAAQLRIRARLRVPAGHASFVLACNGRRTRSCRLRSLSGRCRERSRARLRWFW